MKEKFSKILPFIVISVGFVIVYPLSYWLIFIHLNLVAIYVLIYESFVPMVISACLIWFYYWPKLRGLNLGEKVSYFLLFVSWLLLSIPVLTFLFYLETQTGEITSLRNVNDILKTESTSYYSIDTSVQHREQAGLHIVKAPADRGNELSVCCYFVCPITDVDSAHDAGIWIGVPFCERFSDRLFDDLEKQEDLILQFVDSTILHYKEHRFSTKYMRRLLKSEERDNYLKAIHQTNLSFDEENVIILVEQTGNYESRAGSSLWWTITMLIASNIFWTTIILLCTPDNGKKTM